MNDMMMQLLFICLATFLAGFIDSIAGGGGLISLPAYFAIGLPPHIATGTNKCSSVFGTFFATLRYVKNGKVHLKSAGSAAVAALIGSYFGARLNLWLDEIYLRYILIVVLPVTAILLLAKKNFGTHNTAEELSVSKVVVRSLLCGLVIGAYDGFFGPGTGTFLIFGFTAWIGFDLLTASGNAKVVNLASNIAAVITFAIHGKILFTIGLPAAAFGILGNWLGAGMALKKGSRIIRPMLITVMGILLVKVILDMV